MATLLAAMEHEHERAAGAWHAEWAPLRALLIATGSAAAWLRDCLEHLEVDPERMRANLDGALMAERVAGALGREAADEIVRSGRPLAEALGDRMSADEVARLLDPASYLGANDALIDRALRAHWR